MNGPAEPASDITRRAGKGATAEPVLSIRLLGTPEISPAPNAPARGNKVWALLAYLLRAGRPVTRHHLAGLFAAESEDPMRTLRWNLTQLRHLLPRMEGLSGELIEPRLPPGTGVDVWVLKESSWQEAVSLPTLERELLEGMSFDNAPALETWLLNERRHLKAMAEGVLREATVAHLAQGRPELAIDLAARLVALEPLEESHQGLLIRSYAASGENGAASRQLAACIALFRDELGVEPGSVVSDAIHATRASSPHARASGRVAARARLQAGEAAMKAGAIDAGLDCLRRAAAEAHACDDLPLYGEALGKLGSYLVHAGRGLATQEEGSLVLNQALVAAERLQDCALASSSLVEMAWVELLGARYERCRAVLGQAEARAEGHPAQRAHVDFVRGMALTEMGRYGPSIEALERSVEISRSIVDDRQLGLSLSMLGKTHVLLGETTRARSSFAEALEVFNSRGWHWLVPWTEAYLAEADVIDGDLEAARDAYTHALVLARETGDPCFQSKATAGLGLVERASGDIGAAIELFEEARMILVRTPDHTWSMAFALELLCDAAVEARSGEARRLSKDLEALSARTGMTELLVRAYIHQARLGDDRAGPAARTLVVDVDNPHLVDLVDALGAAAGAQP